MFERWSIEYPWIVGVVHVMEPPVDWKLWVGNVVNGYHRVLDHGNGASGTLLREYPDFAVQGGRVVWDRVVYENGVGKSLVLDCTLELLNLRTQRETAIARNADGRTFFMQPTIYGNTVVWVRTTESSSPHQHSISDLERYRLDTRKLTMLTHNTQVSGASGEPSLWSHFLLFKQSPTPLATGDIILWDLNRRSFPLWRKPGETLLDVWGEMPRWSAGVAWWQAQGMATSAIYVPGTHTVWTLQHGSRAGHPAYYKYYWQIQDGAEGALVVERTLSGLGGLPAHATYFVWHISGPSNLCG